MSTGTINLTFDTPDITLTGTGELDISNYISEMFYQNPALTQELASKISEVFKSVSSSDISTDYEQKLKDAFQVKSEPVNIKETVDKEIKKLFKDLKLDSKSIITSTSTTRLENLSNDVSKSFEKISKKFKDWNLSFLDFKASKKPMTSFDEGKKDIKEANLNPEAKFTTVENKERPKLGLQKNTEVSKDKSEPIWFKKYHEMVTKRDDKKKDTVFEDLQEVKIAGFSKVSLDELTKWDDTIFKKHKADKTKESGLPAGVDDTILGMAWKLVKGILVTGAIATIGLVAGGIMAWIHRKKIGDIINHPNFFPVKKLFDDIIIAGLLHPSVFPAMGKSIVSMVKLGINVASLKLNVFLKGYSLMAEKEFISVGERVMVATKSIFGHIAGFGKSILSGFSKFTGITKFFTGFTNMLSTFVQDILFKIVEKGTIFGKVLSTETVQSVWKFAVGIGGKGIWSTLGKSLLKRIPFISSGISFYSMSKRFANQDWVGGLIDLVNGINMMIPGWNMTPAAMGIGIMLDMLNVGLDIKAGGMQNRKNDSMNKWWKEIFLKKAKNMPLLGNLIILSEGFGALMSGQWELGLAKIGLALGGGMLGGLGFLDEKMDTAAQKSYAKGESPFKKMLVKYFRNQGMFGKVMLFMMGLSGTDEELFPNEAAQSERKTNKSLIASRTAEMNGKTPEEQDEINEKYRLASMSDEDRVLYHKAGITNAKTPEEKAQIDKKFIAANEVVRKQREMERTPAPVPTKFVAHDYMAKSVTYQSAKDDKLYKRSSGDTYAKKDDASGKTFENIEKGLKALNTSMVEQNNIIKSHTEIFNNLLNVNGDQLKMLPNLIPAPAPSPAQPDVTHSRDEIFDYRNKILQNSLRG